MQQVIVSYELDISYLLWWGYGVAAFVSIFCLIALLQGSFFPTAFFGIFFSIGLPINYLFYFYRTKSLFKDAVLGVGRR